MKRPNSIDSVVMPESIMGPASVDDCHFKGRGPHERPQMLAPDGADIRLAGKGITLPAEVWGIETTSGVQVMDELHYDIFDAMDALSRHEDHEFGAEYETFLKTIEQAFRQEEQWMDEIGFLASRTHLEQHARALEALHKVHSRVMAGDLQLGREVIDQLLPRWFTFHLSTMDATLALAMQMAPTKTAKPAPSTLQPRVFSPF